MNKTLILRYSRAFLSLLIAGTIIGLLYPYDLLLAVFLSFLLIFRLYQENKRNPSYGKLTILILGTFISAVLSHFS